MVSSNDDPANGNGPDGFADGAEPIPAYNGRDRPLAGCWKLERPPEGLRNPPRFWKHNDARLLLLGEALLVNRADPNRWISYSRRKEYYALPSRYRPKAFTLTTVASAVDVLTDEGLFDGQRALPGQRWHQSKFRLRSGIAERLNAEGIRLSHCPAETIVVRAHNATKTLCQYEDTDSTRRMRKKLGIINEALQASAIQFSSKTVETGDVLRIDDGIIGPAHNDLHRVFNRGGFDLGGRFYGGWWQSVPSERRNQITIDGKPTSEEDYPAFHPTLLYAECGKSFVGDPYDLPEWDRDPVKLAFNIFLNAESAQSATWAMAKELKNLKGDEAVVHAGDRELADARRLLSEIKLKHGPVAEHFCTGAGLRLQRVDSDLAEWVLLEMILGHSTVCLPIHDSFIVDATKLPVLQETMDKALEMTIRKLTPNAKTSTGYSKLVPQYGETGLVGSLGARERLALSHGPHKSNLASNDNDLSVAETSEAA